MTTSRADTPKHAPVDDRLFLDIPTLSLEVYISGKHWDTDRLIVGRVVKVFASDAAASRQRQFDHIDVALTIRLHSIQLRKLDRLSDIRSNRFTALTEVTYDRAPEFEIEYRLELGR